MRHYRLMILAVLLTLVGRAMADNLTVETVKLNTGDTKQVAIGLNNPTHQYAAFQFDLVLPEGVSIAKNDKGKFIASLSEDRKDDHTLTVSDMGNNTYRFLTFSMTNAEFYGKDGALVYITLKADDGISGGNKTATIQSQVFTEVSGTQYKWENTSFTVEIKGGGGSEEPNPQVTGDDMLIVEAISMAAGDTKQVTIGLNNPTHQYAAFQFDLVLPDGVSIAKNDKGKFVASLNEDRKDDHTLTVSDMGNNTYRFLTFSMTNAEFYGKEGALVYVTLKADDGISEGSKTATIQSQVFTEVSGTQYKWDDKTFQITIEAADVPVTLTAKSYTRVYGDANPMFEYTVSGGTIISGTPTITCSATATSPVGTYDIVIAKGTVSNGTVNLVKGTLTITKAPLTISAGNYTKNEGEDNPTFKATYSGFKNNETEAVLTKKPTITTTATKTSAAGDYPVTVSGAEAQNYNISYTNGTLTVLANAVTLTAKNYTREYGEANPTFEYTVSGGTIISGTPTITCSATATSPVGTYDIVIAKGTVSNGTVNFVKGTLTITKAPLTISAGNYTKNEGEDNPTFKATYSGFKNNETEAVLTKKPTITTIATKTSAAGDYPVTVSGAEAQNYNISYANGTLTVLANAVTLTANSYTREYGEANPTFEYTVSGGTIISGSPTITCSATAISPVGTYDIVIAKGTVSNGTVNLVKGTLTITKAPLTISAGNYTKNEGEDNPTFKATYSGFKNNETEAVLTKKPTITTTATKTSAAGDYPVTVSGAEAQNYNITYVDGLLTITVANYVYITAKSYTRTYGDANPTFGFEALGGVLDGSPIITCEATVTSPVGTYDIIIKRGSESNKDVIYTNGTLTITKAPLTIKAGTYTKKQGDDNPEFKLIYEGFKNDETEVVLTKEPTVTCEATKDSNPGEYEVVVSGAEAQNYDISYQSGWLKVEAAQSIQGVDNDGQPFDAYDILGRKIRSGANTFEELPKGVFIIRQKNKRLQKVVVR